ncbi:hypothetical protein FGO68_gene1359 [Halteria grandinella]|uniref:TMC domain-containing protein n=1 Tax=Halteria grandinella TaxID=5974 RepID=A0A8J8NEH0_HALGN|nr:hypothetical protein FGO68_gene1359 [Halteria grandinella]
MFSMPCLLYYSRFDRLSDNYYSITLILFAIVSLMISVHEWVQFDVIRKKRDLYEDKKKKYSRMVLNMWDWRNAKDNFEGRQQIGQIRVNLKVTLDEERIMQVINKRTNLEKSKLFIRRTTTQIINAFILLIGWGGIITLSLYDKIIQAKLKTTSLSQVSSFVPSIGLSVINQLVPMVSKKITEYEAWDFQDQLVKQQVWRIYLAKIMNLAIFVLINSEMAAGTTWFWDFPLLEFNTDATTKFDCREDFFASNIFKQVLTEFILKIVVTTAVAFVKKTLAVVRRKPQWKAEYELSQEIVWLLYFQAMIWVAQLFFPFCAIIAPVMLFFLFKYCALALRKFSDRPQKSSNSSSTGFYIMIFLNMTLVLIAGLIVAFMSLEMNHSSWVSDSNNLCGPFGDGTQAKTSLQQMIFKYTGIQYLYLVLSNYPMLWALGLVLLTAMLLRRSRAAKLKEYIERKDVEYETRIDELQKSIVKLEKKIERQKEQQQQQEQQLIM